MFKHFKKSKFRWLRLKKPYPIVIFDENHRELLLSLLSNYKTFVFYRRNIIYINSVVIFYFFYYLVKFLLMKERNTTLGCIYYLACIRYISPKIIVTIIDNCPYFSFLHQHVNNSTFIALQNGSRADSEWKSGKKFSSFERMVNMDHYFCFGQSVVDYFNERNANVGIYHKVGNLKLCNFIKLRTNLIRKKKYDICFTSNWTTAELREEVNHSRIKFDELLSGIIEKSKYSFVIVLREGTNEEKCYLKNIFGNKVTLDEKKYEYSTYDMLLQCELLISHGSTLSVECLAIGKKTLIMDFTKKRLYDPFSQINSCFGELQQQLCLYEPSINKLEEKIDYLLNMESSIFDEKIEQASKYFMHNTDLSYFKQEFESVLESNYV